MKNENYIWYASYGSNLYLDRFLCYIKGGRPKYSQKTELGCSDKTLPLKDAPQLLPYRMYFAGTSKKWNNGGNCILSVKKEDNFMSLGRKFLIKKSQFIEIVSHKNESDNSEFNFQEIIDAGSKSINDSSSGNVIFLGYEDGYPIFTFTAHEDRFDYRKADILYLAIIGGGIKQTFGYNNQQVVDYFMKLNGVKEFYTHSELLEQIAEHI